MTLSSKDFAEPMSTMSAPLSEEGSGGETPVKKPTRKRAPRKQAPKQDEA